ncbi:hypothetical protein SASPL_130375 [Salvia splendens]|uniref:25S rRNA (uridine-N(3))-methyltransferase BMT5-like domain-containing protein n=1 Tax=Salvia splendens TaxID=180675 RepID=A0A8X8X8U6_SALSN|nr:hypothetical protein SASPL_130375 [Salvia splendens]
MGNFQSICTRTPDEGGGSMAYQNLQNEYKSNEESILVSLSSIYKAILQKLCVMFNYLTPSKAADPPPPPNAPRDDEEAGCENVGIVTRCQIYSAHRNEVEQEHVVFEIDVEIGPCLDEIVAINEREAKEQVKTMVEEEKWIKHYSSRHSILLFGEGDFSFSACLALAFGSAANIIATSLDSQEFLMMNYGNAVSNIGELRRRGGKAMHEIDATKMANHELLRHIKFDRIIYNFPMYVNGFHHLKFALLSMDSSSHSNLEDAFASLTVLINDEESQCKNSSKEEEREAKEQVKSTIVMMNYGNAMSNIEELRRRDGKVLHGIDATEMANHELLRQLKFDRIIFNFPYAGLYKKSIPTESQLSLHREQVSKFLMNARSMIIESGEIHISHKTNNFHADFDVESFASSHGLRLIEAVAFKRGDYPGYNTGMDSGVMGTSIATLAKPVSL